MDASALCVQIGEKTFDIHCVLFERARAGPPVADAALVSQTFDG